MSRSPFERPSKPVHPLLDLLEPLDGEPTLLVKPMFGGKAVYLDGRFVVFLAYQEEPWRGLLFPTEREHQPALIADRPALVPHAVLSKWLYLSEASPRFETDAAWLIQLVRQRDPRLGIEPGQKKRRPPRATRTKPK